MKKTLHLPTPRALTFALVAFLAATLGLAGCGHGYDVVRSDSRVSYEPGAFALVHSTAAEPSPALREGLRTGLAARAPAYQPTGGDDAEYTVHVRVEEVVFVEGRTNVSARIEITQPDGTVTSELTTSHAVVGEGEAAMREIGHTFGERLGQYLEERERLHHW